MRKKSRAGLSEAATAIRRKGALQALDAAWRALRYNGEGLSLIMLCLQQRIPPLLQQILRTGQMSIGDIITFGNYQWKVLDIKEDKILIITEQIIEQRDYHDRKEPVTWEQSEIRHYLNNHFLERFRASDIDKIQTTHNRNTDNPWYGSCGGADTFDRVFLLSMEECVRLYFGDSSRLLDHPKQNQRYWFDRKDENNVKRMALFMDSHWWWWTRTPGKNNRVAVYIHGDGNIGIQGNGISKTSFNTLHHVTKSNEGGVRPAVWIKMQV